MYLLCPHSSDATDTRIGQTYPKTFTHQTVRRDSNMAPKIIAKSVTACNAKITHFTGTRNTDCQSYFAIDLPSCVVKRRQDKFM